MKKYVVEFMTVAKVYVEVDASDVDEAIEMASDLIDPADAQFDDQWDVLEVSEEPINEDYDD